jgi:hypothetical protein
MEVAGQAGGTILTDERFTELALKKESHKNGVTVYLAGRMSGYPLCNFPAFIETAGKLRAMGYDVLNPAELDLAAGFDPRHFSAEELEKIVSAPAFIRKTALRDVHAIHQLRAEKGDFIALMPEWKGGRGAPAEAHHGKWVGIPLFDLDFDPDGGIILTKIRLCPPITTVENRSENAEFDRRERNFREFTD